MATITASMVKELRESTGAGMMDCKKALTETDGDMEKAVVWLRENGLAVLTEIIPLSARMVVNQVSMKMEQERIQKLISDIRAVLE